MREMDIGTISRYDVSQVDLLYNEDGEREKLPAKGDEEAFIFRKIAAWRDGGKRKEACDDRDEELLTDDEDDENDPEEETVKRFQMMDQDEIFLRWRKHLYNVVYTRTSKADVKKLAAESETVVYCCFDLQQVLDCPYSNVGDIFYKRCLSTYNLVFTDTSNAYCFFWSEDDGNRGVNEIGTSLIRFAVAKAIEGRRHLIAFCDGCGGQNRNRLMATVMSYIVKSTPIESIFICYLEKGHTENSADDVHSLIEREKVSTVHIPSDWPVLIRQINTKLNVLVQHMKFTDIYDVRNHFNQFTNFYKDTHGETILFTFLSKLILIIITVWNCIEMI